MLLLERGFSHREHHGEEEKLTSLLGCGGVKTHELPVLFK
jgi:hypothetical protein